MELIDAIEKRKSIRAFKSDPVPQEMLKSIMEQALRAPSWANTQPWEFVVVTGPQLREIQRRFLERGPSEPRSQESQAEEGH